MSKIAIVGIGNLIMQDDGVGIHIIRQLEEFKHLPEYIDLIDAGVNSYDMVDILGNYDKLIVIDAMQAGNEPGTIYRAPLDELDLRPIEQITSLHEMHFIEAVKMARLMGYNPDILVFGIEPATVSVGLELTQLVSSRVPRLIELIKAEINNLVNT